METGEPVIGVTWRGNNRTVNVYLFTYVSVAPAGDPVADAGGFGDGYTFPGSFANVPPTGNPSRSGQWGSSDGLQMEFHVTWAELGLSPGDPFTFHVSSSNSALGSASFTAQIDDNLSGCGGGVGSTIISGVDFVPDRALLGFASLTTTGAHTITHTGNVSDFFDLSSVSSGDFTTTISYYLDADSGGTLTAADVLLTDTDGDSDPDSPLMAPGTSIDIVIVYAIPAGVASGDIGTIVTTAASDYQPLANDIVTDVITIAPGPDLLVTKLATTVLDPINLTVLSKAIPGAEILYTVTITNQGPGPVDNDSVIVTDAVDAGLCMKVTDLGGGGASFTYTPTANALGCDPAVTDIRILPKGTFPADTGAGSPQAEFTFRAVVN